MGNPNVNHSYPNFVNQTTARAYKSPFGQGLFTKWQRAMDMFGRNPEYYDPATRLDRFEFGDESFNIRDIYQYYYTRVSPHSPHSYLI